MATTHARVRVCELDNSTDFPSHSFARQVCKSTTEYPWCDYTLSAEARAAMVVKNLTDDEKSHLLTNGAGAIPRINWPAYNW